MFPAIKMATKKLNLGCGNDYKEGWVNVDFSDKDVYGQKIKIDVKHDLNKFPYPFKDSEFDEVLMKHVLEHLDDIGKSLKELVRITKKGGRIRIMVPHFTFYGAFRDPTHKHFFSLDSICYFDGFDIISKRLTYSHNKILGLIDFIVNLNYIFYERFLCGIFPVQDCAWELEVTKDFTKKNIGFWLWPNNFRRNCRHTVRKHNTYV